MKLYPTDMVAISLREDYKGSKLLIRVALGYTHGSLLLLINTAKYFHYRDQSKRLIAVHVRYLDHTILLYCV